MSRSKKEQPTIPELSEESQVWMEDLDRETDRGAALVAAAYLDEVIQQMIRSKLAEDKNAADVLLDRSTAFSRMNLARALGLIGPKTYDALDRIRIIRNHFAHSRTNLTFNAETISKECGTLTLFELSQHTSIQTPRGRFISQCAILANYLLVRAHGVEHLPAGSDPPKHHVVQG